MKIAFIIGNGTSRVSINLSKLVGKGTIFGCNALYRNFTDYDYLVAIDDDIIKELEEHANDERLIIPPEEARWELPEYNNDRRRSNAGMNAMLEAIQKKHDKLYCMGFDFMLKGEVSTSNIYKDTDCYGPSTHANESDNVFRVRYLNWCIQNNPKVRFTFVLPKDYKYQTLTGHNVTGIYVDKFKEAFGAC